MFGRVHAYLMACGYALVYACMGVCMRVVMCVWLNVCVCVCVCACVHMNGLTHGCMYAGLDSWTDACVYGRTVVYACMCACVCLYVHVYARRPCRLYWCVYTRMHISVCVCMY